MTTTPHSTLPALTVQPIHFTSEFSAWREFYLGLGLRPTEAASPMHTVLAADSGQLMLHEVEAGDPMDGIRLVELTTSDLTAYTQALQAAGLPVLPAEVEHRSAIAVDLPQGRIHISESEITEGAAAPQPDGLTVAALLFAPAETIAPAAELLAHHGMRPRIASDDGGWTDLTGHGTFALHHGELQTEDHEAAQQPVVDPFLETADLNRHLKPLQSRGLEVLEIDEAYTRSLHITKPDGEPFVINETQQDLYGYHRLDA